MKLHGANNLDAHAWPPVVGRNCDPKRVHMRIGVTRFSATPAEARNLAAELIAAADEVESTGVDAGQ